MKFSDITELLKSKADDKFAIIDDFEVLSVLPEHWIEIASLLKNESKLDFNFLMCISSYDKGDDKTYGVAYNFYSMTHSHYLEIRIEVEDGFEIPSISSFWRAADWHEREAYDMIGQIRYINK